MTDKIGLPLEEIHTRGKVPQCESGCSSVPPHPIFSFAKNPSSLVHPLPPWIDETKLQFSMARFFTKLRVDKPVVRNNYFVQVVDTSPPPTPTINDDTPTPRPPYAYASAAIDPDQIGWSDSTNGPEDVFDQATKEPSLSAQESGQISEFQSPAKVNGVSAVRLRQERQSLRRLPRSGAVVFTIRTYIDPFTELAKEPGVPGRLASAIRSWPEDVAEYVMILFFSVTFLSLFFLVPTCRHFVMDDGSFVLRFLLAGFVSLLSRYKGQELYRDAVLPYLDECHAKQLVEGTCVEGQKTEFPF